MKNLGMTVSGNMVSVYWEKGGARFHVWLEIALGAHNDGGRHGVPVSPYRVRAERRTGSTQTTPTLYKNPPKDTPHRGPGYFKTRYLDASLKAHAATVQKALAEAERLGLYQQAADQLEVTESAAREAQLDSNADVARRALQQLMAEGALGSGLIQQYLDAADRDSLARLYLIVHQTNARP